MVGVGLFDRQAEAYARYRPTYPHSLYKHILKYCNFHSEPECALDIACGSGQATAELAEYFKKVIGIDSSSEQLSAALKKDNITYRKGLAESTGVEGKSVDLVTVAQALHWFNFNLFFIEVARVLKPRGSLAVWGYGLPECPNNEQITKLIFDFGTSESKMGPYWAPERIHIDERYSNIHPDPRYFDSVRRVEIPCSCQWTIDTVSQEDTKMADVEEIKDDKKEQPASKKGKKKGEDEKPELSDEDIELKANLEMMVERISESDSGLQTTALDSITREIREATTSMTSVPKPLKFLRPHYQTLKTAYSSMTDDSNKQKLADVISVLAITTGKEGDRESLKFRLLGSKNRIFQDDVELWGQEYLRNIAGEIGEEYQVRRDSDDAAEDLLSLVKQIVPYHMSHNSEPEAVDLLLEVDKLDWMLEHVDEKNFRRACLYLISCCSYLAEPDDMAVLQTAYQIYSKQEQFPDALRVAMKMKRLELVEETFAAEKDPLGKKQLAYILGQQVMILDHASGTNEEADEDLRTELEQINGNTQLSEHYLQLARDLDVMEAKTPEDVYKSHLVEGRASDGPTIDSARQNLASTFVNGFVNAGFGTDKLVTADPEGSGGSEVHWIFKNKDHGKISATASIGLITLWDIEGGLPQIDKYQYSKDPYVVGGAALAVGLTCTRVSHENDPAFALLFDACESKDPIIQLPAIMGMGLAYADSNKAEVEDFLGPMVTDTDTSIETASIAALALGMVFVGTAEDGCVEAILQALMMRSQAELTQPFARFLSVGLGLLYLGKQEAVEATLEVTRTLNERISGYCQVTLETMAYAGTGDVLKVQKMLSIVGEHVEIEEGEEWKVAHQSPAVLGLALIAKAEDLGSFMAQRTLEHLLQYGEPPVRRAVPLAVALLSISNPTVSTMDMLSRLSHDNDQEVAQNAVLALGLIGAGTNNARLAGLLRSLSGYYYKEPTLLFLVRVAQGLVHMGKGLLTMSPTNGENHLLSGCSLAGILAVMHSALDLKATLGGQHPHLFFLLASALRPRMLMTLDTEGKMLPVPVRVGQAVDTVAQAGRPKTITGFQTHTTPVLLSAGERAELGSDKYLPLSTVLEGVVILKPNPNYIDAAE